MNSGGNGDREARAGAAGALAGAAGAADAAAGGDVAGATTGFGRNASGLDNSASHFSASTFGNDRRLSSDGLAPVIRVTLPDTLSVPIDILKSVSASFSAERSMAPSKANEPIAAASKAGTSCPPARIRLAMKSVSPPVARATLPFTSASGAMRLTCPSKFSVPL